jgi:hypothetical protein
MEYFIKNNNNNELIIDNLKKDLIIRNANNILKHKFNILGCKKYYLGEKIKWNKDYENDFEWKNIYYKKIKILNKNRKADIKFPWELSRFQHLATLGEAYYITLDKKYVIEFKKEIEDWIDNNKFDIGVNWRNSMEVGIRAVNWIIAYYFFSDSDELDNNFWNKYINFLYLKAIHIKNNLEKNLDGHGNNHYLANLASLIWLSLFFRDKIKEFDIILSNVTKEFMNEIGYQFYKEGTNFEGSISYHRLSLEIVLSTLILMKRNNIFISKSVMELVERACEFVKNYTKPNGLAPQIGDSDDGRFHIFSYYTDEDKRDHRHILQLAGEFFNRDDFRLEEDYFLESNFIFGKGAKIVKKEKITDVSLYSYKKMGYYIIKDENIYMIIRCGTLGQKGNGGHSHNDQLSFELNIRGKDIVIDPGTYTYSKDYKMRNYFRGTENHNTLIINGIEQNPITESIFSLKEETFSNNIEFKKYEDKIVFKGKHFGYKKKFNIVHRRTIEYYFKKKEIVIFDSTDNSESEIISHLILDKGISVVKNKSNLIVDNNIEIKVDGESSILDTKISYSYGHIENSKKICVKNIDEMKTYIRF